MNATATTRSALAKTATRPAKWSPSLGEFSKGVTGSVTLNFSESGGDHCDPSCMALQLGVCYAVGVERLKPSVQLSGERKRKLGFAALCRAYAAKLAKLSAKTGGEPLPWVRISSFGSVPNRPLLADEVAAFVAMVRAIPAGTPIHFPVETAEKAARFRAIAHAFNLPYAVRESLQDDSAPVGPASRVVYGEGTKRDRLDAAIAIARASKGAARVCPAIASTILKSPHKVKCGECKLCSRADVETVLYPQH